MPFLQLRVSWELFEVMTDAYFLAGKEAESAMPLRVATSCQSGVSALWRHERRKR